MRSGHLLAEESPHNLLTLYGLSSLEDVFLKLCMKDVGNGKHGTAPVVSTISHGHAYPVVVVGGQAPSDGHDNPAFAQSYGANPDAITADSIDHRNNEDDDEEHKNLAQLSIVSFSLSLCLSCFFFHSRTAAS